MQVSLPGIIFLQLNIVCFPEASLEVVYAKAIKDYANITDDSFLTLRMGDIVLVRVLRVNKYRLEYTGLDHDEYLIIIG